MPALTAKQRRYLKGLAHGLQPVVRIGKGRLSAAVVGEAESALRAHELIKVRIDSDDGGERREMAARLAADTGAHLAGTVGKVAILYRAREDGPRIHLPR